MGSVLQLSPGWTSSPLMVASFPLRSAVCWGVKGRYSLADAGHSCSAWHEHRVGADQTRVFQELCLFRPAWAPAWGLAMLSVSLASRTNNRRWRHPRSRFLSLSLSLSLLMICSKDDFPSLETGCRYKQNSSSVYRPSKGIEQNKRELRE